MNQEKVKEKLLELDNEVDDFSVTFSGKESRKVDGLYKPESREIIIHNRNFTDDNALMYTGIHEFAHHIQFTASHLPVTSKAHTGKFWDILHRLLYLAEEKGIYDNVFSANSEFRELITRIKENYITVDADLMKEFGRLLIEAHGLCRKYHVCFDDFVDRGLGIHRTIAKTIMKTHAMDINPEIGFENMKTVAGIRDEETRKQAEEAFLEGQSPDMVRAEFVSRKEPSDEIETLISERDRLEHALENITLKLANVERRLEEMGI